MNRLFDVKKNIKYLIFILVFVSTNTIFVNVIYSQKGKDCIPITEKKQIKAFNKAINEYQIGNYPEAIRMLREIVFNNPEFVDAYYVLGLINLNLVSKNVTAAEKYFLKVVELCPSFEPYVYFYLGDIYYDQGKYDLAYKYLYPFCKNPDNVKNDEDYNHSNEMLKYSKFYSDLVNNPVPFNPKPVQGISTNFDEYLCIISPDNELAMFTRKTEVQSIKKTWDSGIKYKEKFFYSQRNNAGLFDEGNLMPPPFNKFENEGGPSITIDNNILFYTVCKYLPDGTYYNCDIYYSQFIDSAWTEIKSVSNEVNTTKSWESQPSISSDGKTLYFVSDRPGGFGGYDIYKTVKNNKGEWSKPINLGPTINTEGNEKSPFIHTDSQTLYYSSDGLMTLGGYDIFYSRLLENGQWTKPKNIGYPINSTNDDFGFFVSTDGKTGYFASNKLKGQGGWDLYEFELYNEARPEKVLFIKGQIKTDAVNIRIPSRIELKNAKTRQITEIPVDSISGKYVAAVVFRDDYIMTVKKRGFAFESKYIAHEDSLFELPAKVDFDIKKIEVGKVYKLNDVYFASNSNQLTEESKKVINEFIEFLQENPTVEVAIHGHTDNVGDDNYNLKLSKERAKSVYEYIINNNINSKRLKYEGFGETKPIDTNETEEGRAKNRRTVFVVTNK